MFKLNVPWRSHINQFKNFSTSSCLKEKWDLVTAVCLERKPVITRPLLPIEENYKSLLTTVEFEKSLKSDHEMRHEKELKQLEQLKHGDDVHLKETAQDFEDANSEELSKFKFAARTTKFDAGNDQKSLNRCLDKHLVLVTKQKLGKDNFYLLPQSLRMDGETLRQTADRIIKETVGNNLKVAIYGNAPSGFYKYKYPKGLKNKDSVGAKVFIFFARYQRGIVENKSVDFKWLNQAELKTLLPTEYGRCVSEILISD